MATAPFGAVLEAALKDNTQGGIFRSFKGDVKNPRFGCCVSGNPVGVPKDPVAVLVLSGTNVCAGDNVNADYSRSYSPTSTINLVQIDWGDGNTSSPAWPGAGSANHPLGGYALPGTYRVTLTLTDVLGATGVDEVMITVVDCTAEPLAMLYAGCGSSGVWYSGDGGLSWADAGGDSLGRPLVYDLKINLFTTGLPEIELWTATDAGLFIGTGTGANISWYEIDLPRPTNFPSRIPEAAALCPSTVDPLEMYVLASDGVDSWVYRTIDGGETWTDVHIQGCDSSIGTTYRESTIYGPSGAVVQGHFAKSLTFMYALDDADGAFRIGIRNDSTNTWSAIGGMGIRFNQSMANGDGTLYYLWVCGYQSAGSPGITLQGYDGIGWTSFDGNRVGKISVRVFGSPGYVYTADIGITGVIDPSIRVFDGAGNLFANYDTPGGMTSTAIDMYVYNGELYIAMNMAATDYIYRHLGAGVWSQETQLDVEPRSEFVEGPDGLFFVNDLTYLWLRNDVTGVWEQDIHSTPTGEHIYTAWEYGDFIYVGTDEGKIFKRDPIHGYSLVGATSCSGAINNVAEVMDIYFHDGTWLAAAHYDPFGVDSPDIYRIPGPLGSLVPHDDGRTHLMSMSSDGYFVYFVLINADNEPVVFRTLYDLTEYDRIYEPTTGSWGGVACDFNYIERVWAFGDLTNSVKIVISDTWGVDWTAVGDGSWGAAELVRPLLVDIYDPSDVVAILNDALETWHSGDEGANWINMGAIQFSNHCGVRDWLEPSVILIGRLNAGALHLQLTVDVGVNWQERSTGITANAPITALQVAA